MKFLRDVDGELNVQVFVAIIGASATLLAVLIAGIFGLIQFRAADIPQTTSPTAPSPLITVEIDGPTEAPLNTPTYFTIISEDAAAEQGDNGGPVYEVVSQTNTVRVTGVLGTRMKDYTGQQSCLNGWDSGASRWGDVASYLNLRLMTK